MEHAGITNIASENDFQQEVQNSQVPTVVDLWAPWCAPCIMQGKILEELAQKHGDKVKILKVNVDEVPGVAMKYRVQAIPTLLFFKNGNLENSHVGLMSLEDLERTLGL